MRLPQIARRTPDIPAVPFGVTTPRRRASCRRWARGPAGMLHRPAPLPVPKDPSTRGPVAKAGALLDRILEAVLTAPGPSRWT